LRCLKNSILRKKTEILNQQMKSQLKRKHQKNKT
jgi:hypothetical protein